MKAKGDYLNQVHSDQMVLGVVRQWRLDHVGSGQKQLKGGYQSRVQSDQIVLMMARQGGWTATAVAKDTHSSVKSQWGLGGSSSARSHGSQAGRLDHMNSGQRHSYESQKMTLGSQGTYKKRDRVTAETRVNVLFLRRC
jgi:hypothetical protein